MANAGPQDVVAKLRRSAYADKFQTAFGPDVFDTLKAFKDAQAALQAFQLEDPSFHPYNSKYDLYAGNKIGGTLTPAEHRGLWEVTTAIFSCWETVSVHRKLN